MHSLQIKQKTRPDRTKMLLSKIIHGFKSSTTRIIKKNNIYFAWQRSFYDRIIRNNTELFKTRNYTKNNPMQWEFDRNNQNKKL